MELPTELEGLPTPMQQRIMSQLEHIRASENLEELKGMLEQLPAQFEQAPPPFQKVLPLIERTIEERIAELEGGA